MFYEDRGIRAAGTGTEVTSRLSLHTKIKSILSWLRGVGGALIEGSVRSMAALREEGHVPDDDGEEWWDRYFDTMGWIR